MTLKDLKSIIIRTKVNIEQIQLYNILHMVLNLIVTSVAAAAAAAVIVWKEDKINEPPVYK